MSQPEPIDAPEVWSPDGVLLRVKPAAWRRSAIEWIAFAVLVGAIAFELFFYWMLPQEGTFGPWTIASYALLGLPVPGLPVAVLLAARAFAALDRPSEVSIGTNRLAIDGEVFRRLEVRRVRLDDDRIVVTRIDGTTWRSPALDGLDSPRLHELLDDFGCELEEALDEADEEEAVRRRLTPLLRRSEPEGR